MILRLTAWLFALALLLAPVVAVLNGWLASERWPIERLRVNAEFVRVDEQAIRDAAAAHLTAGFFAVDLSQVQTAVAALPWVDRVEVRKYWPDLVEISVLEHRAYARWGSNRLVSTRGVLFAAAEAASMHELPLLEAPDSRLDDMLRMHRDVTALLDKHGLNADSLRLSARGSWSLQLDSGARVVAGRGDPLPRLHRFAAALPRLLTVETRQLERADLRYANGFSLRWVEKPGLGTGDSGLGRAAVRHGVSSVPATARTAATRFPPSPESRVPSPALSLLTLQSQAQS